MVLAIRGKMKYLLKIPYRIKMWIKELNRWIELRYIFVEKIVADSKASGEMQKIIGLAISLLIASSIMPVTLSNLAQVNTTGWDTTAKTLWPLLSIFGVLAIVLIFMKYVTKK
jgi:small-conductance mechanosensitive channel